MPSHSLLRYLYFYVRSQKALYYAKSNNLPGLKYNYFGRQIGLKLLLKGVRTGLRLSIVPVSSTRYFEFPFIESCLPAAAEKCLDVSSPNLFGLWLAVSSPSSTIKMINPDSTDIDETKFIAQKLGIKNIIPEIAAVDSLSSQAEKYDCIWSISVIEHIHDTYEDKEAIQLLYHALKPGGRLMITVPVDKEYWIEYRDAPLYGSATSKTELGYFTQRFYDATAIQERLIAPIGKAPSIIRWWGEKSNGRFLAYCQRWIKEGYNCIVDDPKEFAEHYQEFSTWDEMPGVGVCGLLFEKT